MKVLFKRVPVIHPLTKEQVGLGVLPKYQTKGSAGADLTTVYGWKLRPGESHLFDLGLICNIPRGHYLAIHPRSGLSCKRKLLIPNAPGVIDYDYKGPKDVLKVMLFNASNDILWIRPGRRIAQCILMSYEQMDIEDSEEDFVVGSRGGFGSTNKIQEGDDVVVLKNDDDPIPEEPAVK